MNSILHKEVFRVGRTSVPSVFAWTAIALVSFFVVFVSMMDVGTLA